jgi:threonine dehydrogenase-like Zn-dependent dehydrogenase
VWTEADLPDLPWDAVIDATTGTAMPARAVDLVEPGGRVVLVGLAGEPSLLDTRLAVLRDVSVVGILGGSAGLAPAIAAYAAGTVDPRPLVGAVVGMADVADVLSGVRQPTGGPKTQVDVGGTR